MPETAVVTGAASGVGAATARLLADRGLAVVGVDLATAPASNVTAAWIQGDVAEAGTWSAAVAAAEGAGGPPAALVANAGHAVVGDVLETSDEDWQATFEVHVFGVVRALRACLPGMISNGGGVVVTVASVDAYMAEEGLAAYCSSKGALLQLTKCVALDFARKGIRANCVCPGVIDTPFFRKHADAAPDPHGFVAEREQRNPLGRLLSPEDVAEVVAFLAGPASAGVTGSAVTRGRRPGDRLRLS